MTIVFVEQPLPLFRSVLREYIKEGEFQMSVQEMQYLFQCQIMDIVVRTNMHLQEVEMSIVHVN